MKRARQGKKISEREIRVELRIRLRLSTKLQSHTGHIYVVHIYESDQENGEIITRYTDARTGVPSAHVYKSSIGGVLPVSQVF